MSGTRVLALSSPIYAHTLNAVPFVEGLAARGVEVHHGVATPWVASRAVTSHDLVHDTGPVPPFVPPGGRVRDVSARYAWLVADAALRVRAVERLVEDLRPDVVLTDSLGYAGALAAERLGLPWVSFGDGPLHFPDELTPPFGAGLPYRTPRPWVWRNTVVQAASRRLVMGRAQQRYAALRTSLGLAHRDVPVLEACLSPLLHLHCGAPELEYPRADLPDHVHFVGALRPPQPAGWVRPSWWDAVVTDHAGDLVLATQGTLRGDPAEVLAPTLRALLATGRAGLLTTGAGDPVLLGGPGVVAADPGEGRRPSRAHTAPSRAPAPVAVEQFVPYSEVLPSAGVFVTNGGWTGVLLALAHGVPVLQVGSTEEKADIGRRVEWAGAGVHLGAARPRPSSVARALARVEGAAYRAGARRVAASLATRDPGRDGAELVLRLLRAGG
ncbi:glycosyltransferase [Ornithinimicrobium sp. W1679]|uniref:glycosyltransferase n=1 Tax=Ornithinimicrobium sp. W1679 TaxID=3418770 RepID=UPI003CF45412